MLQTEEIQSPRWAAYIIGSVSHLAAHFERGIAETAASDWLSSVNLYEESRRNLDFASEKLARATKILNKIWSHSPYLATNDVRGRIRAIVTRAIRDAHPRYAEHAPKQKWRPIGDDCETLRNLTRHGLAESDRTLLAWFELGNAVGAAFVRHLSPAQKALDIHEIIDAAQRLSSTEQELVEPMQHLLRSHEHRDEQASLRVLREIRGGRRNTAGMPWEKWALILDLHDKIEDNLMCLPCDTATGHSAIAPNSLDSRDNQEQLDRIYVMSVKELAIWRALEGIAMRSDALATASALKDARNLWGKSRGHGKPRTVGPLEELMERNLVRHHDRLGYYRPDAPPPQLQMEPADNNLLVASGARPG